MKRKVRSKLSLHRETLHTLENRGLRGVAGGSGEQTCRSFGITACKTCTTCDTCESCQLSECGGGGSQFQSCQGSCEESCLICPTTLTD